MIESGGDLIYDTLDESLAYYVLDELESQDDHQ
jgi:hypothetical protein